MSGTSERQEPTSADDLPANDDVIASGSTAPDSAASRRRAPSVNTSAAARLQSEDVPCLRCGYNLRGLTPDRACPECGTPVQRSLRGNLLIYSDPGYVSKLHNGLRCILIAVLTLIFGAIGVFGLILAVDIFAPDHRHFLVPITAFRAFASIGLSILSVVGWWLFSTPDKAILGHDTGDRPRKVLRATVIITAIVIVTDAIGEMWLYRQFGYDIIEGIASLTGRIAWLIQFFASLLYIRWLARRLPKREIVSLAETYLWLLPLIFIVGFCIVFIGPIVATVLYLLLLNKVRMHIVQIRTQMQKMENNDTFAASGH